jgi:hypothetical protein
VGKGRRLAVAIIVLGLLVTPGCGGSDNGDNGGGGGGGTTTGETDGGGYDY